MGTWNRLLSLGLAFGMAATPSFAQDTQGAPRPAKVFEVAASESLLSRSYPAIVLPSNEVELSFRVSGRVVELPIRGAMELRMGDVIAQLDTRDFKTQIAQLESQRDQASAQLAALRVGARPEEIASLEAAVEAAEAQVEQARDQANRTRALAQSGTVAQARLEQDEAALRVAEATLKTQVEQLAIGRAGGRAEDIAAAEASLRGIMAQLQVARDNLEDATLTAPFDGIVARREIDNFTNIQAGQTVALLQAIETVHLLFDVPGPDVTALTAGGLDNIRNTVVFDALPDQFFDAEVEEFSVQADAATQTYRGRVSVTPPADVTILPGMVGRVVATAPRQATQSLIPLTSVAAAADGSPYVWVLSDDNTASRRPVTLGAVQGGTVAVVDGLKAGDRIIAAGISHVSEGLKVRPITKIGG